MISNFSSSKQCVYYSNEYYVFKYCVLHLKHHALSYGSTREVRFEPHKFPLKLLTTKELLDNPREAFIWPQGRKVSCDRGMCLLICEDRQEREGKEEGEREYS